MATNSFQAGIIAANQGLELFKKGLHLIGNVGEHAFATISQGRGLRDLSARTGESVGNLYQLEKAFKESGVSGDNVATVLFRFQKSLSGIGEMGESTVESFQALGVSMEELSKMDAPQALLKVFEGINKLDRNAATGVASAIFGRGAAGDFLQLARNHKDFNDSLEHSASKAALFNKNAEIFTQIDKNIVKLKNSFKGLWLQVADSIAPSLNGIFAALANRDVPMFAEILELSLTVAFEKAVSAFAHAFAVVVAAGPGLLKGAWQTGEATMGTAMAKPVAEWLADMFSNDPSEFGQEQARIWALAADQMGEVSAEGLAQAAKDYTASIKAGLAVAPKDLFAESGSVEKLQNRLKELGLLPGPRELPNAGGIPTFGDIGKPMKFDANALERIGFGSGFGNTSDLNDSARKTAVNTQKIYEQQKELNWWLQSMYREFNINNL